MFLLFPMKVAGVMLKVAGGNSPAPGLSDSLVTRREDWVRFVNFR